MGSAYGTCVEVAVAFRKRQCATIGSGGSAIRQGHIKPGKPGHPVMDFPGDEGLVMYQAGVVNNQVSGQVLGTIYYQVKSYQHHPNGFRFYLYQDRVMLGIWINS